MRNQIARIIGLTLFFLLPEQLVVAQDQGIDTSPNYFKQLATDHSPLALGKGFTQNDLTTPAPEDCLTYSSISTEPGGASNVSVDSSVVSTYSGLLQSMGFNVEAHAQYLTASADAEYKQQRSLVQNDHNVTIVLRAHASYPNRVLNDPELKKPFNDLITAANLSDFKKRCGTRYPKIEVRGVSLVAVVTISDASEQLKQQQSFSTKDSYGSGSLSGSLSASFNSELNVSKGSNRLDVKVFANGGDGLSAFESLIRNGIKEKVTIDAMGDALAVYARTMTDSTAVPIGYYVVDMPGYDVAKYDPWSEEKSRRLSQIVDSYQILADRRAIVDSFFDANRPDPRARTYNSERLDELKVVRITLTDAVTSLTLLHRQCMAALAPDLSACPSTQDDKTLKALALEVPAPLYPPRGRFAVAVHRISDRKWVLLSDIDWGRVFQSPAANTRPYVLDYTIAHGYSDRWVKRVITALGPGYDFAAELYLIHAENLQSVEAYAVATDASHFKNSARADITRYSFGERDGNEINRWTSEITILPESKDFIGDRALVLNVQRLPTAPDLGPIPVGGDFKKYMEWAFKFSNDLESKIDFDPDFYLPIIVNSWSNSLETMAESGRGSFMLHAIDTFSGEADFDLMDFDWDADEAIGVAKVNYTHATGEPGDTFYATGLNPGSLDFPTFRDRREWDITLYNGKTVSQAVPFPKDKWGDFVIKACDVKVQPAKEVTVSYEKSPRGLTLIGLGSPRQFSAMTYHMAVEATYLIKTSDDSYFGQGFLDDFNGCKPARMPN